MKGRKLKVRRYNPQTNLGGEVPTDKERRFTLTQSQLHERIEDAVRARTPEPNLESQLDDASGSVEAWQTEVKRCEDCLSRAREELAKATRRRDAVAKQLAEKAAAVLR